MMIISYKVTEFIGYFTFYLVQAHHELLVARDPVDDGVGEILLIFGLVLTLP